MQGLPADGKQSSRGHPGNDKCQVSSVQARWEGGIAMRHTSPVCVLERCLVFSQVVVNQNKEAVVSKEVDHPAETLVSTAAWQVVIAGVGLMPLRRRWQGWWVVPWLCLPSWRCYALGKLGRDRGLPHTTPVFGRQVVQILEAEWQPDSIEA